MKTVLFYCFLAVLSACATTSPRQTELGFETKISEMRTYLESINLYPDVNSLQGIDLAAKQNSRRRLIENRAKDLASVGVTPTKLRSVAGSDAEVSLLLTELQFSYTAKSFPFNLALSELVVIATVDKPINGEFIHWSGPYAFELKINRRLKGSLPFEPIAIMNPNSSESRVFFQGMECLFFLSPTLTEYRKIHSEFEFSRETPKNALAQSSASYCTNEDDLFTVSSFGGGSDSITRKKILSLSEPYP